MSYSIYTLSDPRDGSVRYIGLSKNPYKRFGSHLTTGADPHNEPKKAWINDLLDHEMFPVLTILERIEDINEAYIRESALIEDYLERNVGIFNMRKNLINAKNRALRSKIKAAD